MEDVCALLSKNPPTASKNFARVLQHSSIYITIAGLEPSSASMARQKQRFEWVRTYLYYSNGG